MQDYINQIRQLWNTNYILVLIVMAIPVALISIFKIKVWKPKKTVRRRRTTYRRRRRTRRRR